MATYKVFFYIGEELGLKTRALKGRAWLDDSGLHVEGPTNLSIPRSEVRQVEMFRLHGLGRVIQVDHTNGRLFVSVVRLMIGQFAFINFFKTGDLFKKLLAITNRSAV